jgi:hypothetical protein
VTVPFVDQEWQAFRALLSPKTTAVEVNDLRRAFYAGVSIIYRLLTETAGLTPEQQRESVRSLHRELQGFARDVRDGRA